MSNNAKELLHQLNTPEDLRRLLDTPGIDDDTIIEQFMMKAGSEVVLDQLFSIMATRFKPSVLRTGVLEWSISAPDSYHFYQLNLAHSGATVTKKAGAKARVTLSMTVPALLRLCSGRLSAFTAFRTGQLDVQGNLLIAAMLPLWFDY